MSSRSFASVGWVATVAGAALGCYLVSLRVAAERAALETIETKIVLAQRDIRLLQTEIGTRGRLAQLERWNARVLALSAPKAEQFLDGGFALAKLARPRRDIDLGAPVVLASAPASRPTAPIGDGEQGGASPAARDLFHTASLRREPAGHSPVAKRPPAGPAGGLTTIGRLASGPTPTTTLKSSPGIAAKPTPTAARSIPAKDGAGGAVDPLAPISAPVAKDSSTAR